MTEDRSKLKNKELAKTSKSFLKDGTKSPSYSSAARAVTLSHSCEDDLETQASLGKSWLNC